MRPNIFSYTDYRKFFSDMVKALKTKNSISMRMLVKKMGLSSPAHFSMIQSGKRNLSLDLARKVAKGFELSERESAYFEALVSFNQSKSQEDWQENFRALGKFSEFRPARKIMEPQLRILSEWYIPAFLEALGNSYFSNLDLPEQAESLGIKTEDLKQALEALKALGFIRKDRKKWRKVEGLFETINLASNAFIQEYHSQMSSRAQRSLQKDPPEARDFNALILPLTAAEFQELKQKMDEFLSEIHGRYSNAESAEKLFHLNLQVFPLADLRIQESPRTKPAK